MYSEGFKRAAVDTIVSQYIERKSKTFCHSAILSIIFATFVSARQNVSVSQYRNFKHRYFDWNEYSFRTLHVAIGVTVNARCRDCGQVTKSLGGRHSRTWSITCSVRVTSRRKRGQCACTRHMYRTAEHEGYWWPCSRWRHDCTRIAGLTAVVCWHTSTGNWTTRSAHTRISRPLFIKT